MLERDGTRLRFSPIARKVDDSMSRCAVGPVYCLRTTFLMFANRTYCVRELVKSNHLILDCRPEMACALRRCYASRTAC
jgi:hypothetical protein